MPYFKHLFLFSVVLMDIAGQIRELTWQPNRDMEDQDVDPEKLCWGFSSIGLTDLFRGTINDKSIANYVKFYYYSSKNPDSGKILKPGQNNILVKQNIQKPFKFIIHGYLDSSRRSRCTTLREQLLKFDDVNVVTVDWSKISIRPNYFKVVSKAETIGRYVSRLIDFLIQEGADPKGIHLIGHSLGAHISGFAGANAKEGRIGRITGLDPALPGFRRSDKNGRLDPTDAVFVDCIHTAGGTLGFMKPICHADFYPNGGRIQPGCLINILGTCSHLRAPTYFSESVDPQNVFMTAVYSEIPKKSAVSCKMSEYNMGYYLNSSARGIFYVEVSCRPPYSRLD